MNSYNVFKHGGYFYGSEINDGQPNYEESIKYDISTLIERFIEEFPNLSAYSILKEFDQDIIKHISGEQIAELEDKLKEIVRYDLYANPPSEPKLKVLWLVSVYEILVEFSMNIESNTYNIVDILASLRQVLLSLGFNTVSITNDYLEEIYNNLRSKIYG